MIVKIALHSTGRMKGMTFIHTGVDTDLSTFRTDLRRTRIQSPGRQLVFHPSSAVATSALMYTRIYTQIAAYYMCEDGTFSSRRRSFVQERRRPAGAYTPSQAQAGNAYTEEMKPYGLQASSVSKQRHRASPVSRYTEPRGRKHLRGTNTTASQSNHETA